MFLSAICVAIIIHGFTDFLENLCDFFGAFEFRLYKDDKGYREIQKEIAVFSVYR